MHIRLVGTQSLYIALQPYVIWFNNKSKLKSLRLSPFPITTYITIFYYTAGLILTPKGSATLGDAYE